MTIRKTSQERRIEIADAAIKILGERGLPGFTAAQLAEEVGIKDGTIFRHVKDKHEIMLAVVERLGERLLSSAPRDDKDPMKRLEAFVSSRIQAVASKPGILSLIFSDQLVHALGEEGGRYVAGFRNRGREFLRSCLREAAEKKQIPSDTDIESATLLINGLVIGILFAAKDGALAAPIEQVADKAWKTLMDQIQGR